MYSKNATGQDCHGYHDAHIIDHYGTATLTDFVCRHTRDPKVAGVERLNSSISVDTAASASPYSNTVLLVAHITTWPDSLIPCNVYGIAPSSIVLSASGTRNFSFASPSALDPTVFSLI